jgi:hypothetical protein
VRNRRQLEESDTVEAMRAGVSGLVVSMLIGCGGAAGEKHGARACIADNPPGSPFDVGDVVVGAPPPGSPAPDPPSAETIADMCAMYGGTGCYAGAFISKAAASCIATLNEFEAGLEPWRIALTYHDGHKRVVWNVTNKLVEQPGGAFSGQVLTIDGTAGNVLGRSSYGATP